MPAKSSFLFLGALASVAQFVAAGGDVFAHMIIGNDAWMTAQDWQQQIATASAAGIDGFALNIALDSYTDTQLGYAYAAAAQTSNFKMFISFDYDAAQSQGGFNASYVAATINKYKVSGGQYMYNNQPLVSTFEGTGNAGDWPGIKSETGCFFVPDWTSIGPQEAAGKPGVDGLLSWDAWPEGATDMPTSASTYKSTLGSRPFMMPVTPWFYTDLPSKNWLWRGDDLWHLSWVQAQQLQPALIEILTWNDWGESHYISPNPRDPSGEPSGASTYVSPSNHSAWLADLPYYIASYKGDTTAVSSYTPHITFWYRLSPGSACGSSTPCNAPYQNDNVAASSCDLDAVFFTAFPPPGQTPSVTVSLGGTTKTVSASSAGVWHSSLPLSDFGSGLGAVSMSGAGMGSATGDPIQNSCVAGWNAFVATTA